MVKIPHRVVAFMRERALQWLSIPIIYLLFWSEDDYANWNPSYHAWEPAFSMAYIFLLWEGNYSIGIFWCKKLPEFEATVKRLVRQLLTSTVFILLVNLLFLGVFLFIGVIDDVHTYSFKGSLLSGLLVSYLIIAVYEGVDFYNGWKTHVVKSETLAREKSEIQLALVDAQLSALRDQLNPHFLFNSLNTLSSLIDLKNKKAITYLEQLADVYRYLLENREKHLISLNEELTFASAYISLNKTRFRDDLSYKVELDTAMGGALLPPYALQLTLENAIKHNAIGRDKTLQVEVTNEADYLVVSNNKRPKPVLATSTGMGLENLRHRSLLATGKPIEVIDRNDRFTVKIPVVFQDDQFSNTPGSTNVNTSQHAYSNY